MMRNLPFELDRYFVRTADTIEIPLSDLVPGKPHAIERANELMFAAYNGEQERRAPITVVSRGPRPKRQRRGMTHASYKVIDGNSTLVNAAQSGWPTILAVVEKPYRVFEAQLHDPEYDKTVATFETRWEAESYVDDHDDEYSKGGYALFIDDGDKE